MRILHFNLHATNTHVRYVYIRKLVNEHTSGNHYKDHLNTKILGLYRSPITGHSYTCRFTVSTRSSETCTEYTYRIAGNCHKVKISCFSRFDPIRGCLFAKLLISTHKGKLSTCKLRN